VLEQLLFKSTATGHPLSADYRDIWQVYSQKYSMSILVGGVHGASACLPCPPNLICTGNNNPPISASAVLGARNITSLFYGVLPVGAGSERWWVPCPTVRDAPTRTHQSPRHSLGLSSCFRGSTIWSAQTTGVPRLHSSSFPALIVVNATNTSLITVIVNVDQNVYYNKMHAVFSKTPVMELRGDTELGDMVWLVSMEMDTGHVVARFGEALALKQGELLQALHAIDQSTGVAFSTLLPLLWACAVRQYMPTEMGEPVFIVPGVVHSIITQNIAVRTITAVMDILDLSGPAPRHLFQLSSRQMMDSVSTEHAYANPLFFMHNNLCDSYYNSGQGYTDCRVPFGGTLLSAYTTTLLRETKLLPLEDDILASSNALQHALRIDTSVLALSMEFLCPDRMLTENLRIYNGAAAKDMQRCQACTDSQFWHDSRCQQCETSVDTCEHYSRQTRSKPCSWTQDLICEVVVSVA